MVAFDLEKLKTCIFSVAVVVYDIEVLSASVPIIIKGQGYFSDLGQRSLVCCLSAYIKNF